jgi:hypothetical protein
MRREVDVLIVDLPAVVAPAMGAAFMIADVILIPVAPQAVDIEGSRRVLAHLEAAAGRARATPPKALLVPSRVREMERGLERWETMLEPMGLPSTGPMRHHIGYDRAFERGQWVGRPSRAAAPAARIVATPERGAGGLGLAGTGAARRTPARATPAGAPGSRPRAAAAPRGPRRPPRAGGAHPGRGPPLRPEPHPAQLAAAAAPQVLAAAVVRRLRRARRGRACALLW